MPCYRQHLRTHRRSQPCICPGPVGLFLKFSTPAYLMYQRRSPLDLVRLGMLALRFMFFARNSVDVAPAQAIFLWDILWGKEKAPDHYLLIVRCLCRWYGGGVSRRQTMLRESQGYQL